MSKANPIDAMKTMSQRVKAEIEGADADGAGGEFDTIWVSHSPAGGNEENLRTRQGASKSAEDRQRTRATMMRSKLADFATRSCFEGVAGE
jgi:hypothetical protein